ncbi:MAG TPA: hypothetical protein VF043_09705 [Ktedonobacteraceae bacterium]
MATAVETAMVRTAVMSARVSRVTAVKTSMVRRRMVPLAVRVLVLNPGCVLERTTLLRRTAGAFSGSDSLPVNKESRESFPPLGIWSSHYLPDQAPYTCNEYDADNNKESREKHDLTLLLLYDAPRKANALAVE